MMILTTQTDKENKTIDIRIVDGDKYDPGSMVAYIIYELNILGRVDTILRQVIYKEVL